jgi:uncharacterized protein (TIGR03905 family)
MFTFKTSGVCSRKIQFSIENDVVKNVIFTDGCDGNLTAISILVEGMMVKEVIEKLEKVKCGHKNTSCPAQLAAALKNEWLKTQLSI